MRRKNEDETFIWLLKNARTSLLSQLSFECFFIGKARRQNFRHPLCSSTKPESIKITPIHLDQLKLLFRPFSIISRSRFFCLLLLAARNFFTSLRKYFRFVANDFVSYFLLSRRGSVDMLRHSGLRSRTCWSQLRFAVDQLVSGPNLARLTCQLELAVTDMLTCWCVLLKLSCVTCCMPKI